MITYVACTMYMLDGEAGEHDYICMQHVLYGRWSGYSGPHVIFSTKCSRFPYFSFTLDLKAHTWYIRVNTCNTL